MDAKILVFELQRSIWIGEACCHGASQGLGMDSNSPEVVDIDYDMQIFLHVEILKVLGMDGNRGLKWCSERLCRNLSATRRCLGG